MDTPSMRLRLTPEETEQDVLERELRAANYKAQINSGKPDYPYWRRRRAALLRKASEFRELTDMEQHQLADNDRWESPVLGDSFEDRLDTVLEG